MNEEILKRIEYLEGRMDLVEDTLNNLKESLDELGPYVPMSNIVERHMKTAHRIPVDEDDYGRGMVKKLKKDKDKC